MTTFGPAQTFAAPGELVRREKSALLTSASAPSGQREMLSATAGAAAAVSVRPAPLPSVAPAVSPS